MHALEPVNRLMTEAVLSVEVTAPVSEALRLFAQFPVHHLPVVRDGVLVGMLSSADVLKFEGFVPKSGKAGGEYLDQRFRLELLMRRPAISVLPHQSAEDAARLMVKHGIHALPVVNSQDKLLGIITTTDLMHAAMRATAHRDAAHGSEAEVGSAIQLKPGPEALKAALQAARIAASSDHDVEGIAQALLYLQQRVECLEEVARLARRYLAAGQDETLHASITKALQHAEQVEDRATARPGNTLGLVGS